jgi:hypothetical protein
MSDLAAILIAVIAAVPGSITAWRTWHTERNVKTHTTTLREQSHTEHGQTAAKVDAIHAVVMNGNGTPKG